MKSQSKPTLILASTSKYRAELLAKLKIEFTQIASDVDESLVESESPQARAIRLSQEKAKAVLANLKSSNKPAIIIGSDQVAHINGNILRKPGNFKNAFAQLTQSSGGSVNFETAITVISSEHPNCLTELDTCTVNFRELSESEITNYLCKEQPYDCCGSFKSEGLGISLFESIQTSDPNSLIGLPLILLHKLLKANGIDTLQ